MGYGSRAIDLLVKYYQGELVSLDENVHKKQGDDEGEEEDHKEGK